MNTILSYSIHRRHFGGDAGNVIKLLSYQTAKKTDFGTVCRTRWVVRHMLESGDRAHVYAVTGHGFSLVTSLMYIFRGLILLSGEI